MDMLANTFMRAPGESGRHVRAGMRARRAGRGDGARSDRAAPPDRARQGSDLRQRPFPRATCSKPMPNGAEKLRLVGQRNATCPVRRQRGRMADRDGRGDRHLPLYTGCRAGRHASGCTADGHAVIEMASHEMGMGTATVQAQARGGAARPAGSIRCASLMATPRSARPARWRADRRRPPPSARRLSRRSEALFAEPSSSSRAMIRRWPGSSPTRSRPATAACGGRTRPSRGATKATARSSPARSRTELAVGEADAPLPLEAQKYSMHSYAAHVLPRCG